MGVLGTVIVLRCVGLVGGLLVVDPRCGMGVWGMGDVEGVMWHVGVGEIVPCTHCGSPRREACFDWCGVFRRKRDVRGSCTDECLV